MKLLLICSVPSAVVSGAFAPAELDQPAAELTPIAACLVCADGFHALLDRTLDRFLRTYKPLALKAV